MTIPKPYTVRTSIVSGSVAYRLVGPDGSMPWRTGDDHLRLRLAMEVDALNDAFAAGARWMHDYVNGRVEPLPREVPT